MIIVSMHDVNVMIIGWIYSVKGECIEFTRSSPTCGSGKTSVFFQSLLQREQINRLTSFIDGSQAGLTKILKCSIENFEIFLIQVYGSDTDLATSLRNLTNDLGRLREGITYVFRIISKGHLCMDLMVMCNLTRGMIMHFSMLKNRVPMYLTYLEQVSFFI